jgi:hypothetical protein
LSLAKGKKAIFYRSGRVLLTLALKSPFGVQQLLQKIPLSYMLKENQSS